MSQPSPLPEPRRPDDGSGTMFDRIAARYDLVNRVISLGVDRSWRRKTARSLALAPGQRVLDVATGTADLALEVARTPSVSVVGLDPSANMLAIGRRKVAAAGLSARIELVDGSAEELPFPARSFDAACMAFGIRNVPDRERALRELFRVLRPGGHLAILELAEPQGGLLGSAARFHVHTVVPWVGATLSGAHEYRYLQRSIAAFPSASAFAALMERVGFVVAPPRPLTFGVVYLYAAAVPT